MSPMLRGEALPLPHGEIADLRETLPRDYGDAVVGTSAGPLLVLRVPHGDPDFLRDIENAVDVMPYRDLKGFRGAILLGDRGHMGVSIEMIRTLLEGRERALNEWIIRQRVQLDPWGFRVGHLPSDPKRRLRVAFRVDLDSVRALDDPHFERLATVLPSVKAATPGQVRPLRVHLVAHEDHVELDGGAFFTDLERRRRRHIEKEERARRLETEEKHAIAVAHLERITAQRQRAAIPAPERVSALPPPPVPVPRSAPSAPASPSGVRAAAPERRAPLPAPSPPQPRHGEALSLLRAGLEGAGYRVKDGLTVKDLPIAIAGARPTGYPTRVLVISAGRLAPDQAHRIVLTGRSVGAELVLVVADDMAPEASRVVLATNVKVIRPDEAADVRFG